jgi:hypothetical protein
VRAPLLDPGDPIDLDQPQPPGYDDLVQDLGLDAVIAAAAGTDPEVGAVVRWALAHVLVDPVAIGARQAVLADFLAHPSLLDALLDLCTTALTVQRAAFRSYFMVTEHPDASVRRSTHVLVDLLPQLARLRDFAEEYASIVESAGLQDLFAQLRRDFDDRRLEALAADLEALTFADGVLSDASLGPGGGIEGYRLRRSQRRRLTQKLADRANSRSTVQARQTTDDGREISAMRDHALRTVAADLDGACLHLVHFLDQLRLQLRLFRGAVNLDQAMANHALPRCVPQPADAGSGTVSVIGVCDLGLALRTGTPVVGNDLQAPGGCAVVVTGANNGGKSTYLRSLGQAQVLMQAGFTVPAEQAELPVVDGVHTHFRRGEDRTMTSGKLAEEMERMSAILDRVRPNAMVLFNESFATTYELEGTRIATNVVRALNDSGVSVIYVTHMYELVRWFADDVPGATVLVAQRRDDGSRTFRVLPGAASRTSHALELYDSIVKPPGGGNADLPA